MEIFFLLDCTSFQIEIEHDEKQDNLINIQSSFRCNSSNVVISWLEKGQFHAISVSFKLIYFNYP